MIEAAVAEVGEKAPAKKLEENDLLRLQNAFLQLHALNVQGTSIKTQFEILRRDAQRIDQETEVSKKKLMEVRDGIAIKYKVDLKKVTVDDEGNFVPLDQKKMPFPVNGGK